MAKSFFSTNKKLIIGLAIISALVIASLAYYELKKRTTSTPQDDGIAREIDLTPQYNTNSSGVETNIDNVFVIKRDGRAVDGDFVCTVFKKDDGLILATYRIYGGLRPPGADTRPRITYKSEELSKRQIDEIIENYCDDTPTVHRAPHLDQRRVPRQ
ncbi:MAG TPA: hypothetical protein VFX86_04330 [Candidatus Saccharimonadales bacterium]|nr:hypothetical protein [Candidatus Saccharimonadales bacterium]